MRFDRRAQANSAARSDSGLVCESGGTLVCVRQPDPFRVAGEIPVEVLRLIAAGNANKEIAAQLELAEDTRLRARQARPGPMAAPERGRPSISTDNRGSGRVN